MRESSWRDRLKAPVAVLAVTCAVLSVLLFCFLQPRKDNALFTGSQSSSDGSSGAASPSPPVQVIPTQVSTVSPIPRLSLPFYSPPTSLTLLYHCPVSLSLACLPACCPPAHSHARCLSHPSPPPPHSTLPSHSLLSIPLST